MFPRDNAIKELEKILKDFYPKEQFFKAGLFHLKGDIANSASNTYSIILIKKTKNSEILYSQIFFHNKKFHQMSVGPAENYYLDDTLGFMGKESVDYQILTFKTKDKIKEQEIKITKTFENLLKKNQ